MILSKLAFWFTAIYCKHFDLLFSQKLDGKLYLNLTVSLIWLNNCAETPLLMRKILLLHYAALPYFLSNFHYYNVLNANFSLCNVKPILYLWSLPIPPENIRKRLISWSFTLREKCPNTEFFLVHIFLHLNWIRRFTT